ncbi:MAG: hypothetical protein ACK5YL_01865, partial [Holosporales bacterium]
MPRLCRAVPCIIFVKIFLKILYKKKTFKNNILSQQKPFADLFLAIIIVLSLGWEGTKAMKIDPMAEDTNSVRLFN